MDIGIDLGTTFSVIAVNGNVELSADYPAQGVYLEECDITIIPAPDGDLTFPSVILEDPDNPGAYLFGSVALQRSEEGYAPVLFSKRRMGTKEEIPLISHSLVARDVACEFLRYLKTCAEQALGCAIKRAVVTHPAYFDRGAVEETRQAAAEAGFDMSLPEQLLMEPVAAALTYTRTDKRDPLRILTYDLGGGTFDVTYLERKSGIIDMRAFDGDHLLGGYNFDRAIVHWLRKRLEAQGRQVVFNEDDPEDRSRLARLLRIAENVKIALSKSENVTKPVEFRARAILVDVNGKEMQVLERITRQQFVELTKPLLDRTVACCQRALNKAGVELSAVDELLMVGGSTYGPWIEESLAAAFPGARARLFFPDLCVAAGAAIHAKMALAPVIDEALYQLRLDVPEISVLDTITVAGKLTSNKGGAEVTSLSAQLRTPDAKFLGPNPLSKQGGFLFNDVELREGEPSKFTLTIVNSAGTSVLDHTFQVTCAPDYAETSAVTTVLPKPLYILTLNGLIPLAQEGTRLPARCKQTFQRINDNPNISLRLFQERDQVGEVRIEGIPPEGGRGAFVDLEVEVTEKNEICGHATVRTRDDRVAMRSKISVHFEVPEVPNVDELKQRFELLKFQLSEREETDIEENAKLKLTGTQLIEQISRQFEQQPLERQEIAVALRQLDILVNPPADEMVPTRREFLNLISSCRKELEEMAEKAKTMLAKARGDDAAQPLDRSLLKTAESSLNKAVYFQRMLERFERDGLAAHEQRDRKTWAIVYDNLTELESEVQERPDIEGVPTYWLKLLAGRDVMIEMARLEDRERAIERIHNLRDWEEEIDRIKRSLTEILKEVSGMNDNLASEQALAQIRLIFTQKVQPLKQAIERLGEVVATI
jgi:molecular chaperone DnaK (HSP70)